MNYRFPQFSRGDLSLQLPSASEEASNLISLLCSWDPCKRPTAAEALQHPFFQACTQVPQPLQVKATAALKTPSTLAKKSALDQKNARRNPSNTKQPPTKMLSTKTTASSTTTVIQRRLELDRHETKKNVNSTKNISKQPRHSLHDSPVRTKPGNTIRKVSSDLGQKMERSKKVSEVTARLSQMSMSSLTGQVKKVKPSPPPPAGMKAGGWHRQSNYLGRSSDDAPSVKRFSRKVAG